MLANLTAGLTANLVETLKRHPAPWTSASNFDRNGEFFAIIDGNGRVVTTYTVATSEVVISLTNVIIEVVNSVASQLNDRMINMDDLRKVKNHDEVIPTFFDDSILTFSKEDDRATLMLGDLPLLQILPKPTGENQ